MTETVKPPGRLALSLGANAVAACTCEGETFNLLVKIDTKSGLLNPPQVLVAIKCVVCDKEAPVPLDAPEAEDRFKIFDNKIIDPRDLQ